MSNTQETQNRYERMKMMYLYHIRQSIVGARESYFLQDTDGRVLNDDPMRLTFIEAVSHPDFAMIFYWIVSTTGIPQDIVDAFEFALMERHQALETAYRDAENTFKTLQTYARAIGEFK